MLRRGKKNNLVLVLSFSKSDARAVFFFIFIFFFKYKSTWKSVLEISFIHLFHLFILLVHNSLRKIALHQQNIKKNPKQKISRFLDINNNPPLVVLHNNGSVFYRGVLRRKILPFMKGCSLTYRRITGNGFMD